VRIKPSAKGAPLLSASTQFAPIGSSLAPKVQWGLLVLLFGTGFFGYLMPTLGYFTMIPGDLGDARFNSVILEHCYQWLNGRVEQLWSPGFFYPFERVLGLSDNHFGSFWSYALLRSFGLTREMAYSGWFLLGTVLNFWVCWWALKRTGLSIIAAGAGAFTFTFALPMLHQEGHAQLVYRFAIPLAFFAWYRVLAYRDLASLTQTVFWCAVQFLCSIYLGVFLVYALIALLAAHVILRGSPWLHSRLNVERALTPRTRSDWIWLVLALNGTVVVLLLLREYHQVSSDYQLVRSPDELRALIPKPSSYLLADNSSLTHWVGAKVAMFPERPEHQLFIGFGAALLAGLGSYVALRSRVMSAQLRVLTQAAMITLGLLVMSTLRLGDFSLYLWLAKLPGIDAIRAVSRVIMVVLLPSAVLVAASFEWLSRLTLQSQMVKAVWALVAILILTTETVCYLPRHFSSQAWTARQTALSSAIQTVLSTEAILFVTQRAAEPFYLTELDAMIYAQDHHISTLNGYSGSTPAGYAYPDPCLSNDTRLKGYFSFRALSEAQKQSLLARLHTVELEPCRAK
jgi:hypothetical protein